MHDILFIGEFSGNLVIVNFYLENNMKGKITLKAVIISLFLLVVGNVWGQYKLPFTSGASVAVSRNGHGPCGSHCPPESNNNLCYSYNAIDFVGNITTIVATRGGCVRAVKENSNIGACNSAYSNDANYVIINHGDGTEALYLHLAYNSVLVQEGDYVVQGQVIATMGNTGYSCGAHLHFQVQSASPCGQTSNWWKPSLPVVFDDINSNAGLPTKCNSPYISQNISELYKDLNQSLSIYGGSVQNPKPFYLYFDNDSFSGNFNPNMVSELRVANGSVIPNSRITSYNQHFVGNKQWMRLRVQLQPSDVSHISNSHDFRNISLKLTSGGQTKTYENNSLYFANFSSINSFEDIGSNIWMRSYITKGADLGLFRGNSLTSFGANNLLERQHAAKILVEAAVRLGLININVSTTQNGAFSDVPQTSEFFKHIQTLRNYGYIQATNSFNPVNAVTIGEMCKLINHVFQITENDLAQSNWANLTSRRIVPVHNDQSLQLEMTKLLRLVDIRESSANFWHTENVWDFYDYSKSNLLPPGASYTVNGTEPIKRGIMAKMLTNVVMYKSKKLGLAHYRTSEEQSNENEFYQAFSSFDEGNVADFVQIGEKYDNTTTPTQASTSQPSQLQFSCNAGGSIVINYTSGANQHYFWSMEKNGANLTANNATFSSVTFTAPQVTQLTQFKIYTYTSNTNGTSRESEIFVNVGGSSTGNSSPAHSLNVYNITQNSMNVNWTRGNGTACIVTCHEVGTNSQDAPDPQVIYTGNSNYNSAPAIFNGSNTKVVYTGTGTSVNITGLEANTQYRITVYEYNGNSDSNVVYNYNNPPMSVRTTLNSLIPQAPQVSLSWSPAMPFTTNTNISVTGSVTNNYTSLVWSTSGNAILLSGQGTLNATVAMGEEGNASVILTAYESANNLSGMASLNTQILNPNQLFPDLVVSNANINEGVVINQNFTVNGKIANLGTDYPNYIQTWTKFYLSEDNQLNSGDYYFSGNDFIVEQAIPSQSSIDFSKTILMPSWVQTGEYFILVQADGAVNVEESNENNNIFAIPITVQSALPDFEAVLINISPVTVSSGQQFSVTSSFKNIGQGQPTSSNILVEYYLSEDNLLSSNDRKLNYSTFFNELLNSPINTIITKTSNNVRLPIDLPTGNYYLIAAIDYSFSGYGYEIDFNHELSEDNNWIATPITVSNPNQPTINASNYTISNVTGNSLRLNWTRGNGEKCLVLASANAELPYKTADERNYNANSNFSLASGIYTGYTASTYTNYTKVVYDGTGNYVDVTGLEPNETYSFIVLEYNGTGVNKDYYQNTDLKGISAHTSGQVNTSFNRIFGTITSTHLGTSIGGVKFFNPNQGVVYNAYNGIGITNNGGISWNFIQNNVVENNIESQLHCSSWLNGGYGWLGFSMGKLIKTTDFGNSWSEAHTFDRTITDVYFVNENLGYTTFGSFIANSNEDGAIYKTTDGGNTWLTVGLFSKPVSSVFFLNENLGWATSYSANNAFDKIFLKTTDGGNTWAQSYFHIPNSGTNLATIYFVNEQRGFAMTLYGTLLKTIDGGLSWTAHNIFNVQSTINSYSQIEFINENVGYINLLNKKLAKTTDGGETWDINEIHSDFPNTTQSKAHLSVVDGNMVFVSGVSGILKSTTGGTPNNIVVNDVRLNYCQGSVIDLSYQAMGVYGSENSFIVQLSNNQGSFTNSQELYSFTNSGSGTLNIFIPSDIVEGNSYKIRIVASNPSITSNETNTFNIVAGIVPSVSVNQSKTEICDGELVVFIANPVNAGNNPQYTWKRNGITVGTNNNLYSANDLQSNEQIWVEMTSSNTCGNGSIEVSEYVSVNVTSIGLDDLFIQSIDNILAASVNENVQWYLDNEPIMGANNQFYEASQTGTYHFSVAINDCMFYSETYMVTENMLSNDIVNPIIESGITIYPNPFTDELNLVFDNVLAQQVQLFDFSGRLIIAKKINQAEMYKLSTNELLQGTYVIKITTDKATKSYKIIKK